MTLSFGLTLALSYAFDAALPALPLLSLGIPGRQRRPAAGPLRGEGGFTRTGVSAAPPSEPMHLVMAPHGGSPRRASRPSRRRSGVPARAGLGEARRPRGHDRHRRRHPARLGHARQRRGRPSPAPPVVFSVWLGWRDQASWRSCSPTSRTRRSRSYRRWLSPCEFRARFAPAQGEVRRDRAAGCSREGFDVVSVPAQPAVRDRRRHGGPGRAARSGSTRASTGWTASSCAAPYARPAHPRGAGRLGDAPSPAWTAR